jgi:putative transposase
LSIRLVLQTAVEAGLAEALGPEAALSKSTVSRICQAITDEFDTWPTRSLAEVELEYLYLDASHFRTHPGARAEPVLCAWGITRHGKPVLLALDGANAESTHACLGSCASWSPVGCGRRCWSSPTARQG